MVAKADIRDKVKNRLANIPSAVTNAIIEEYVDDAHLEIENFTGDSFATSDIPAEYQAIITDIAVVKVIDYMLDDLVEKSVSVGGDVTINYADIMASLTNIKEKLEVKIEKQLNLVGVRREFDYTEP